ncbi:MAG: AAA family ATPase [Myxococcota bacterium]
MGSDHLDFGPEQGTPSADGGVDALTAGTSRMTAEAGHPVGVISEERQRWESLVGQLTEGLVERDEAARMLLLAVLAGEHVLLIGAPGTAKSMLARRLHRCFRAGAYFERLLTRFSVPEELFGPLSIRGLEEDRYTRLTEGFLPTATIAFLDEVFKANSAILNALLTLLHEREFDNGAGREPVPLLSVVGASNELPESDELGALYDRFLLRLVVEPVSDRGFDAVLRPAKTEAKHPLEPCLDREALSKIQAEAASVILPASVRDALREIRRSLQARAIYVSDRRWQKLAGLLRVMAATEGRTTASILDVWICEHALWNLPEQRKVVAEAVRDGIQQVLVEEPKRIESLLRAFEAQLDREHKTTAARVGADGRTLFVDERSGASTTNPAGPGDLFVAPRDFRGAERSGHTSEELWEKHFRHVPDGMARLLEWTENSAHVVRRREREVSRGPRVYSEDHIARRREQVALVVEDLERFERGLSSIVDAESLWIAPKRGLENAEAARDGLRRLAELGPLRSRIEQLASELSEDERSR